jgi:hypothetical protein
VKRTSVIAAICSALLVLTACSSEDPTVNQRANDAGYKHVTTDSSYRDTNGKSVVRAWLHVQDKPRCGTWVEIQRVYNSSDKDTYKVTAILNSGPVNLTKGENKFSVLPASVAVAKVKAIAKKHREKPCTPASNHFN